MATHVKPGQRRRDLELFGWWLVASAPVWLLVAVVAWGMAR